MLQNLDYYQNIVSKASGIPMSTLTDPEINSFMAGIAATLNHSELKINTVFRNYKYEVERPIDDIRLLVLFVLVLSSNPTKSKSDILNSRTTSDSWVLNKQIKDCFNKKGFDYNHINSKIRGALASEIVFKKYNNLTASLIPDITPDPSSHKSISSKIRYKYETISTGTMPANRNEFPPYSDTTIALLKYIAKNQKQKYLNNNIEVSIFLEDGMFKKPLSVTMTFTGNLARPFISEEEYAAYYLRALSKQLMYVKNEAVPDEDLLLDEPTTHIDYLVQSISDNLITLHGNVEHYKSVTGSLPFDKDHFFKQSGNSEDLIHLILLNISIIRQEIAKLNLIKLDTTIFDFPFKNLSWGRRN
jgi:hypothetical protein